MLGACKGLFWPRPAPSGTSARCSPGFIEIVRHVEGASRSRRVLATRPRSASSWGEARPARHHLREATVPPRARGRALADFSLPPRVAPQDSAADDADPQTLTHLRAWMSASKRSGTDRSPNRRRRRWRCAQRQPRTERGRTRGDQTPSRPATRGGPSTRASPRPGGGRPPTLRAEIAGPRRDERPASVVHFSARALRGTTG